MTISEFWYDDPRLARYYRKANRLRIQRRNQEMYMQGLYNFQAFSRALANLHFDSKFHKPVGYLDEPYEVIPKTKEEQKVENAKTIKNVKAQLTAWKSAYDKKQGDIK